MVAAGAAPPGGRRDLGGCPVTGATTVQARPLLSAQQRRRLAALREAAAVLSGRGIVTTPALTSAMVPDLVRIAEWVLTGDLPSSVYRSGGTR